MNDHPFRASDVLAKHEQSHSHSGGSSSCSCGEWYSFQIAGGPDVGAWSYADHLVEALQDSGFELVRHGRDLTDGIDALARSLKGHRAIIPGAGRDLVRRLVTTVASELRAQVVAEVERRLRSNRTTATNTQCATLTDWQAPNDA